MHMPSNFRFLLAAIFLTTPQSLFADNAECYESKLALLDQNLMIVHNLLKIRHDLVQRTKESPGLTEIIDDLDGTLLLNISTTTLKEAFGEVYSDELARKLYEKNAKAIMQGFCKYRPKNIKLYRNAMEVILTDCNRLNCEKCNLGFEPSPIEQSRGAGPH